MGFQHEAKDILYNCYEEIIDNYNQTALLLNSCERAAIYYHSRSSRVTINTIGNIPAEFRLDTDISSTFSKKDLIEQYEKRLAIKLAKDYLVTTITTLDGLMEDLYELVLTHQELDKTEEQIKRMIRWGDTGIPGDLITRLPALETHSNSLGFKLEDFLNTYEHLRQIRHAIVHTKGLLRRRHLTKMQTLEAKMNDKQRGSVKQFYDGDKVVLSPLTTLVLRHWCLTFISFLTVAFTEATEE
ncbi:hypothetical protein LC048_00660 [Mesobacillus subterraneus]|uniref:hypothetical protein n=1 Tax=Mesobacillus subterraneus TaxID=285983 RepID=UPI001CFDFFDD|nr:hypothetical protein [Mesobacillus subterraneus]WLR55566.1 hypothetical protein LC048_00660 [Mesobacillus subterraneus]